MKALVFTDVGKVKVLDVDEPVPAAGETLVHVAASGICGSELHGVRAPGFRKPGLVMGHEFCGTTDDGRRVVVNPLLSCGHCESCRSGATEICRDRALVGVNRWGGFAERVAVPDSTLHELPDDMPWKTAALVEPLANAVHALNLAGRPRRVGIIGAGAIGLVCLLIGAAQGCDVHVADVDDHRRGLAGRLGATQVSDRLVGEYDVVLDAVGSSATRQMSVDRLRPGGLALWLGLQESRVELTAANDAVRWQRHILGSFGYRSAEFAEALRLVPRLNIDWTSSFPLSSGAVIFNRLMNGDRSVTKALLNPDGVKSQ